MSLPVKFLQKLEKKNYSHQNVHLSLVGLPIVSTRTSKKTHLPRRGSCPLLPTALVLPSNKISQVFRPTRTKSSSYAPPPIKPFEPITDGVIHRSHLSMMKICSASILYCNMSTCQRLCSHQYLTNILGLSSQPVHAYRITCNCDSSRVRARLNVTR